MENRETSERKRVWERRCKKKLKSIRERVRNETQKNTWKKYEEKAKGMGLERWNRDDGQLNK